jgi:D-glycero-D-manno-heptose 1,7-bisphosphate phosphatase
MDRSALFLDRDGVINLDHGYVRRSEQFEFVSGIFELARFWTGEVRRPIIVVSNQSGIGRGYFDEDTFAELTRWMCERFTREGAPIARVYHCPYHPEHGVGSYRREHAWRKPNPGMLLQAASDFAIDLTRSVIIGDKLSDIEAGAAAGVGLRILIGVHNAACPGNPPSCEVANDLDAALAILRSHFSPDNANFRSVVP